MKKDGKKLGTGKAPKVILMTHQKVNPSIVKKIKKSLRRKPLKIKNHLKRKQKNNSFIIPRIQVKVWIFTIMKTQKTIPIVTTLQDVKTTITKLEKLYKKGKYNHRRITQVAMIMRVRLKILDKSKAKNKEQIINRYKLAKKYGDFLKTRTPLKEQDRKAFFNF